MSTAYKVEQVPSPQSTVGEGPHWDADTQSLYYVDILKNNFSIHRHDVTENKTYSATIEGESQVSFIIPIDGTTDLFAVGIQRRVGVIQWDGKSSEAKVLRIVFDVAQSDELQKFNDGKADPIGRFYGGTVRTGKVEDNFEDNLDELFTNVTAACSLYRYDAKSKVVQLRDKVKLSNGLAWNEAKNKFYYIDSLDYDIKEFDYDPVTGDLSNERVLIDFTNNGQNPDFLPDGMTIDTEGNLYLAGFNGSKVLKINPTTAKIELEIELPVKQVTSVAFGGENFDVLYVTTASFKLGLPIGENDGLLFKVTGLGVKGFNGIKLRDF